MKSNLSKQTENLSKDVSKRIFSEDNVNKVEKIGKVAGGFAAIVTGAVAILKQLNKK